MVFLQSDSAHDQGSGVPGGGRGRGHGGCRGWPYVENVQSPLRSGGSVSEDGHAALVDFEIAGDSVEAKDRVDPVLAAVARIQSDHSNLDIEQFGAASANKAVNETISDDLKSAGLLSIPITLIILLITFGTLVAAGMHCSSASRR